ncbi:hypothetical protein C0Q70_08687 [Pomacea canaliculata]|uniref:PARP14 first type I KH domain-containing protein n=1 Tax=Pomacea canaliculata TaxID=400727 RepID=A0A2T7P7S7_POMCA|nr:hypothetical protein C0Q70_08687 [Pomacea canaliculata]
MASTPSSRTLKSPVNVAKPTAKLLQRKSVMLDLFGELMDSSLTIDRSSIASGAILVTHGDPKKVADTIHKVVGEINVLAAENDEQVLNVLNSLKEKFPGQFDTDFERSSSTYISAFHRKVKTEVEPEIASLATKTGRFSVSRQHMNYLQCHLDHLQEDVHASWPDSGVSITVQMEDRGQGSLLVSSKRFDFEDVKGFIENFAANVQQFSKDVEPSRALFLSSGRGQKEVRRLEREHNCRVSVLLPVHQVLVRAECPRGHQLFLCEGNMAATDCSLLTTKTELYAKFLGGSPKAHRLKLQSQRPEDEQTIWLLYLPDIPASHPLMPEELADGLAEALRLTSSCGAGLAVPLAMSVKHSLDENLNSILRVIEDHLKEKENSETIFLYLEKSSASVKQTLVQTILVPSDFQERSCILDTEIKPGLSLCRLSESMTSELGAGRDARGQKYKEKNEEKKKDEEKPVRTVEVNVGDNIQTEDTYIFYFETRRHGGGDVEKVEIEREKGIVRVTFVKPEVAARVASQQHKIAGQPVEVTLYVPPIPKPPYPDKLLFHNVAESTTRDCLAMYLERITGQEPTDLMYADEVGDVLAGKRSGGGPVEKVAIDHENGRCLVFFENYEVIEKILEKSHTLDGSQLKVRLYMECLGPSGGRRDGNIFVLPRPVEFREVDKYKVAFIQQSSTLQGGLTHQLTALHAKPKFSDNTLSVECTLTTSVEHARLLARTWTNDVQNAVNFIFSMVVVFRQDVVQEIWDETEKSVTTIRPVSQDCAIILTLSEEKMFIVVGVKCMADHLMKQVKRIVNHKEEEFWDVDSQGEINVYSFSDKYLVNAIHIMQKSLVQHQRPLEPETADLLMSPEWNQFVGKITGDYVGVLKIVHLHNGHQLFIAGTDNIMLAVIEETERFLKENTIYMLSYHFFPSLQIFVANYWRAKVMRMSNNLRAYKVEVSLDESGKEFHIRGTKTGLDLMTKNFEQLGSEVKCHMQTLTDPAKVRFLSTPNWEKELEKLGRSTQCVFSLKEEPVDLVVQSDSSQRITSEVASKPSVNPKTTSGSVRRSPKKFSSSSEVEVTKLFVYGESTESIRRALRRFDDLVKESSQAKKLWMA